MSNSKFYKFLPIAVLIIGIVSYWRGYLAKECILFRNNLYCFSVMDNILPLL